MVKNAALFFVFILSTALAHPAEDELIATSKEAALAESLLVDSVTDSKCSFRIQCKANGKEIAFDYITKGNVCNQSNPGALLLTTKNKRYDLGIKGYTLKKTEDFGNSKKICDVGGRKYPAKILPKNKLVLFLRSENLPGYDKLGAVLIDIKENKILTFTSNLGQIKNTNFAMLNTDDGLKTRLVKQTVKGVRCDCDAAYVDDWKEISVKNNLFKVKWMESKK